MYLKWKKPTDIFSVFKVYRQSFGVLLYTPRRKTIIVNNIMHHVRNNASVKWGPTLSRRPSWSFSSYEIRRTDVLKTSWDFWAEHQLNHSILWHLKLLFFCSFLNHQSWAAFLWSTSPRLQSSFAYQRAGFWDELLLKRGLLCVTHFTGSQLLSKAPPLFSTWNWSSSPKHSVWQRSSLQVRAPVSWPEGPRPLRSDSLWSHYKPSMNMLAI